MNSSELLSRLEVIIDPIAARFETFPEHWIHGWDEGPSFCFPCAEKKVSELANAEDEFIVAGGYRTEGDSRPYCETCGDPLDSSYTEFACGQELDHFEEYGFDPTDPSDCNSLSEILAAQLWEGGELSERIQALARKVISNQEAATGKEGEHV